MSKVSRGVSALTNTSLSRAHSRPDNPVTPTRLILPSRATSLRSATTSLRPSLNCLNLRFLTCPLGFISSSRTPVVSALTAVISSATAAISIDAELTLTVSAIQSTRKSGNPKVCESTSMVCSVRLSRESRQSVSKRKRPPIAAGTLIDALATIGLTLLINQSPPIRQSEG